MAEGVVLAEGTPTGIKQQVRNTQLPDPTMEDAFIALIERREEAA